MPAGWQPLDDPGPFLDHVGPLLAGPDGALGLQTSERHANLAGKVHGGMLATLVDSALGRAIRDEAEQAAVTVSLTTDYLGAVEPGDWLEAHTRVERLGGRLAFADCLLRVEDRELVRGRAVFAVL